MDLYLNFPRLPKRLSESYNIPPSHIRVRDDLTTRANPPTSTNVRAMVDPYATVYPIFHPHTVDPPYTQLAPVECPAPPPSPCLKPTYIPQEVYEKSRHRLRKLLKWELNELLPIGVNEVPNPTLNPAINYLFAREKQVQWDAPSRASQVKKRMLTDPRFIGTPGKDWGSPKVWDRRARHPIDGYEIDENEYYLGVGGYYETWQTWQEDKRGYWLERILEGNKKNKKGKSILGYAWGWFRRTWLVKQLIRGLKTGCRLFTRLVEELAHGLEDAWWHSLRWVDKLVHRLGKAWWQSTQWVEQLVLHRLREASGQSTGGIEDVVVQGPMEDSGHISVTEGVAQRTGQVEERVVHGLGEAPGHIFLDDGVSLEFV